MRTPRILPKFLLWADEIDDAGRISDQNHLEAALGSPWLPGRSGYRKIEEFCAAMGAGEKPCAAEEGFAWVRPERLIRLVQSLAYAIPQHVHGRWVNARLMHCLFNPSIDSSLDLAQNVRDFHERNNKHPDRTLNFSAFYGTKTQSYDLTPDDVLNHVMCPENILYRELKNIIGPDITDQESFTRTERYYLRNYDSALLVNDVDGQYYEAFRKLLLRRYRAGTLGDYVHQTVKNLRTCNVELYPFRSSWVSGVEDLQNVYSDFSAQLVLYRLARYLRDEQESEPGFWLVMRSRGAWYRQIQSVLTNPEPRYGLRFNSQDARELADWIFTTYAYEHPSRSAIMTPQNLRSLTPKANGSLQKGERMSADEYTRLKRGILPE